MTVNQKPINVYRGEFIESTHDVHVAVVNAKGECLYSYGDPFRQTFARSSMKPFQAVPLIETGAAEHFSYEPKEISISCASHNGEAFHRENVLHIIDKIGLTEDALQCGTHIPRDVEGYKALIREGKELTPVFSNCSGKHSGMLATAAFMKEDPATYRDVPHPVQQRILQAVSDICDVPVDDIALSVDGCGVPVHRIPLERVAFGYARLASGTGDHGEALTTIREAMMAHPEMIGGTDRFDTDFMKAFKGRVVSKGGAEGVQCIGLVNEGLGIALKVEDGNARATSAVSLKVLKDIGFIGENEEWPEKLQSYAVPPVKNMREDAIGKIEAIFELEKRK